MFLFCLHANFNYYYNYNYNYKSNYYFFWELKIHSLFDCHRICLVLDLKGYSKRFQKNAVESVLDWAPKQGPVHSRWGSCLCCLGVKLSRLRCYPFEYVWFDDFKYQQCFSETAYCTYNKANTMAEHNFSIYFHWFGLWLVICYSQMFHLNSHATLATYFTSIIWCISE